MKQQRTIEITFRKGAFVTSKIVVDNKFPFFRRLIASYNQRSKNHLPGNVLICCERCKK